MNIKYNGLPGNIRWAGKPICLEFYLSTTPIGDSQVKGINFRERNKEWLSKVLFYFLLRLLEKLKHSKNLISIIIAIIII